ncbi:MAG: hypothetical protein HY540_01970 [Deltaproteobacteria bacterium]|nr:hypothetical protein [Deltaproteobacteria bacterium]
MIHLNTIHYQAAQVALASQLTTGLLGHAPFLSNNARFSDIPHVETIIHALHTQPCDLLRPFTINGYFSFGTAITIFHHSVVNPYPVGPVGGLVAASEITPSYQQAIHKKDAASFQAYTHTIALEMEKAATAVNACLRGEQQGKLPDPSDQTIASMLHFWNSAQLSQLPFGSISRLINFMPPPPFTNEVSWLEMVDFAQQWEKAFCALKEGKPSRRFNFLRTIFSRQNHGHPKRNVIANIRINDLAAAIQDLKQYITICEQQRRDDEASYFHVQRGLLELYDAYKKERSGMLTESLQSYADAIQSLSRYGLHFYAAHAQVKLNEAFMSYIDKTNATEAEQVFQPWLQKLHPDVRNRAR